MWFSHEKTSHLLRKCLFSLKARGSAPLLAGELWGGARAPFSKPFCMENFTCEKKVQKSRQVGPKAPLRAQSCPRGLQKDLQNRPREGSEACFEAAVVEKRRNLTKHDYLLYKSHIRTLPKNTFFDDFRIRNGVKKRPPRKRRKSDAKNAKKMSRKRPRSSTRAPRASPRVPK